MSHKTSRTILVIIAMTAVLIAGAACSSKTTTFSTTKTVNVPGPTFTSMTTTTVANVVTAQQTPLPTTAGGPVSFVSAEVVPPLVPAGPTVKISLRNDSDQPVVAITLILWVVRPGNVVTPVQFAFDISGARPLAKNQAASATMTIVGPGNYQTLATVNVTTLNGQNYSYMISVS